ncbi:MAG TPA: hypothetical protein PKX28_04140 [Candidatus Hydrogenedentes bacterium]|nr:hypothetical protein [Candidatus Hydrogenedentota bacterium]HPO30408.1 hypothetical protein [Candidatus Hydrogenedentota bacterium]
MFKRVFVVLLAMAVVPAAMVALAEDAAQSCDAKVVKVTGENVELLAAAGGGEGDEKFGKLYALKVESVSDEAGNCLGDAWNGRILCYVPTKAAAALLSGELKGKVTVTGKLVGGSVLVVESASAAEAPKDGGNAAGGDEWEEIGVKTLSQQQVI